MSHASPNPAPSGGAPFPKPPGVTLGVGLTTPSPELAQICGNSGFDFVMIDMEHGPIHFETAYRMVTALAGTPAAAWIRVSANDATLIKRALDTGATDIVVPMVTLAGKRNGRCRPRVPAGGIRGWGPFQAHYRWRTPCSSSPNKPQRGPRQKGNRAPGALQKLGPIPRAKGLGGAFGAPFNSPAKWGPFEGGGPPRK